MIRILVALLGLIGLATPALSQGLDTRRIDGLAELAGFNGLILISQGDTIIYARAHGEVRPDSGERHRLDSRWRWASITKQIVATLAMREVAAGQLDLDTPIAEYWPDFPNDSRDTLTARHLLQHMSGLPDPESTQSQPGSVPEFYAVDGTLDVSPQGFCAGPSRTTPGSTYSYTNCDFVVLGGLIERVSGRSLDLLAADLFPGTHAFYPQGQPTVSGYHHDQPEHPVNLASYGAAGSMNGTIHDLWRFDRALMRGDLMPGALRDEMWTGDPAIGYAALGQWVFPAPLAGCREPQRLVERPGAIIGVQGRNYLLPELDMAIILFTNRSEGEFPLGHIAHEQAFGFDVVSAAICRGQPE